MANKATYPKQRDSKSVWFTRAVLNGISACTLILVLTSCATHIVSLDLSKLIPERTMLSSERVALPTKGFQGMLCVEARINGAGPFHLIVDTGACGLALSAKAAAKAKLVIQPGNVITRGIYAAVYSHVAHVESMESGGLRLEQLYAIILAEDDFATLYTEDFKEIDGLIGIPLLRDALVELDFPAKQVIVARAGSCTYPDAPSCPFIISKTGIPVVEIELGGKKVEAEFDTGACDALGVEQFKDIALLHPPVKFLSGGGIGSGGQQEEFSQLKGDAMLGSLTLRNPPLSTDSCNRVGVELLQSVKVVVDQHEKKFYFLNTPSVIEWNPELRNSVLSTFGFVFAEVGPSLRVMAVVEGGPAAISGLRPADCILTVNGEPVRTSKAFAELAKNGKPAKPPALLLKHQDRDSEIELTLVESLNSSENIKSVIANCDRAIVADKNDWPAYNCRAAARRSMKDYCGAYLDYQRVADESLANDWKDAEKAAKKMRALITERKAFGLTLGIQEDVFYVLEVHKQSAGELTGLSKGDQITKINGQPAASMTQLFVTSARSRPNEPLDVSIKRDGTPTELTLKFVTGANTPDQLNTIIANCNLALRALPQYADAYRLRADAKRGLKDYDGACVDYNQASMYSGHNRADEKAAEEMHLLALKSAKH